MVEGLEISRKSEALMVLKQAFTEHPMLPLGTPIEKTEAFLELVIDTFAATNETCLYGIRHEGSLACVSFVADSQIEPTGKAKIQFFFRLFRIMGWWLTMDFIKVMANQPKYEASYLDLFLLGTLPGMQGEGLGRAMLQFLFNYALENGYGGIVLDVAKGTPAHRFYLTEGFVVEKEFSLRNIILSHMRRDNDPG